MTTPLELGTFVPRDEHERIAGALAVLASERGYDAVTIAEIAERAGVDRDCFDRHYATKEDCFTAGYDIAVEQAFSAAGEAAFERRQRAIDLFSEFLEPGFAQAAGDLPDRQLLVEMIAGGIFRLLALHAATGRLSELPQALPAVTMLTLGPFVDQEELQRLTATPGPSDV